MSATDRGENLVIPDRCLVAFVDDTGHEALVKGQPFYGLGGCAVMGRDLNRLITQPWRAVRQYVTGSPDAQLHASEFPGTEENIAAVSEFFRKQSFFRFGAIFTADTELDDKLSVLRAMKVALQGRISEIVRRTLCKEVKVIFEASDRADDLIKEAFQDFEVHRGWKHIPSECYFMPKAAGSEALEVADFVVHTIGRQVRRRLKERGSFVPDFRAIFHAVDRNLTSFIDVASVVVNDGRTPPTPPAVDTTP
jgi:hypothetical protein